jgi:hypothetical protein
MAKKKAKKSPAKKSLKLRKKPLRDLPAKKTSTKVKGGSSTLTPSQLAALQSKQPTPTFAPPYIPVQPSLQTPRPR